MTCMPSETATSGRERPHINYTEDLEMQGNDYRYWQAGEVDDGKPIITFIENPFSSMPDHVDFELEPLDDKAGICASVQEIVDGLHNSTSGMADLDVWWWGLCRGIIYRQAFAEAGTILEQIAKATQTTGNWLCSDEESLRPTHRNTRRLLWYGCHNHTKKHLFPASTAQGRYFGKYGV